MIIPQIDHGFASHWVTIVLPLAFPLLHAAISLGQQLQFTDINRI